MSDGSAVSFPLSISCLATHAAERLCRSGRERNYRREPGNGGWRRSANRVVKGPSPKTRQRRGSAVSGHSRPRPGTAKFDPLRMLASRGRVPADTCHQRWPEHDAALVEMLRQRRFRLSDNAVENNFGRLDIVDQIRPLAGRRPRPCRHRRPPRPQHSGAVRPLRRRSTRPPGRASYG
jgi:hypothetical protein